MSVSGILALLAEGIIRWKRAADEEARRLAALVRRSEERFRNLVESTHDWMWETDDECKFTYSNSSIVTMLGLLPWEIIGKRGGEFGFNLHIPEAASNASRIEDVHFRRGSTEVWLRCTCSRFFDHHGKPAGYRGVCVDVTDLRRNANRRRALETDLNRADKAVTLDQVMSMVAHELNQPLAAVATYCGASLRMLRENPDALDDVISCLNAASSQAQVASAAIRSIRHFIVRQEPNISTVRMQGIVGNAISLVEHRLVQAKIHVEDRIGDMLSRVLADEILITQVLLNLLHNAIDAVVNAAEPRIVVSAVLRDDGWVWISVEDNGIGMSDEEIAHCAEPYVTTKPSGLGLGLSICQAMVDSHGGVIHLSRNVSGGCTATFSLEADAGADALNRKVLPQTG